jgi:hypothetical protein
MSSSNTGTSKKRGRGKTPRELSKIADESFAKVGNPSRIARAIKDTTQQIKDKFRDKHTKTIQKSLGSFFAKSTPSPLPLEIEEETQEETVEEPVISVVSEESENTYVFFHLILEEQ